MSLRTLLPLTLGMALLAGHAMAQDNDESVSRSEIEALQQQIQALQERIDAAEEKALSREEADDYFDYLEEEMREIGTRTAATAPGTSRFLLTGYGTSGFTYRSGEEADFKLTLVPIFLWQIGDRLFFEAEPKFSLRGQGETRINLEYANLSMLVNDYLTVGAGQFLTPFSIFGERLHAAWINKLPDAPMAFDHHGGLVPESDLGAFVRGGVPLGPLQRMNYAFYVSNGPRLVTEGHHSGDLAFDNWDNVNRTPAVGGRVGWLPFPELEVGYSVQYAPRVDPSDFGQSVGALLQAVDLSYVREVDWLNGRIDLRSEWVLSDVDDATYFRHDGTPRPEIRNRRWGGYVQGAYRPTMRGNEIVRNTEYVYRYDIVDHPSGAGTDTNRHTLGLNYWLTDTAVIKSAFQYARPEDESSEKAVMLQVAVGF